MTFRLPENHVAQVAAKVRVTAGKSQPAESQSLLIGVTILTKRCRQPTAVLHADALGALPVVPSRRSFCRVHLGGGIKWQLQAAARACDNYSGLALRRARPGGRSESTRGFRRDEPDGDQF
ncbi:MAG: hypothetical protein ACK50J_24540 [Planctomyces sp.]